jgi:hypothetical protein
MVTSAATDYDIIAISVTLDDSSSSFSLDDRFDELAGRAPRFPARFSFMRIVPPEALHTPKSADDKLLTMLATETRSHRVRNKRR